MTHSKMRLIVASNNSNKLREFHEILGERRSRCIQRAILRPTRRRRRE